MKENMHVHIKEKPMNYIGIDLGTSAVKLLLMQGDGNILKSVNWEYPISFPKPVWFQQDPGDWYRETMAGMKELLSGSGRKEVAGISFGGQMHGLVVLDEKDDVIRPAILWNDARTAEESDYLNHVVGQEILAKHTVNTSFPGFTAPKVLWMKNHEPENYARIHKLMLPKDYLAYRLCGVHCTDVSDASGTLFFDVEHRCWSKELCGICGIQKEWLPKVYESYEAVGCLKPEIAEALGLPETVKVAAGAGDNAAAAVGTGTVGDKACNISLGTSGTKSPLWRKILANVLDIKIDVLEQEEGSALGGAMLAAVACGEYQSVEQAAHAIVKVKETIEPEPGLAAGCEARYQQFKEIYPACRELFGKLK